MQNINFVNLHKRLFILNILSLCVFVILAYSVVSGSVTSIDQALFRILKIFQSETITHIMIAVSTVFQPFLLVVGSVLLFCFLFGLGEKNRALIFLCSLVCGLISVFICKEIFAIARPISDHYAYGFSFPSYHATAAAIFFLSILFTLEKKIHDKVINVILSVVCFGTVFLTGLSRLYLEVHWLSDVLAGFALGIFWLTLSFLLFYRIENRYV